MKELRFAIIGAGAIARAYEAAFRELKGATVVAVCDTNGAAAQELASRIGCEAYSLLPALLRKSNFDAAIVCTPPVTHESITCKVLQSGRHVLCEKPLAITVNSARRMLAVAE
ncbi:MAG: Gfo/Idh/MocA family oxidoreductase, partial [Candidatus Cybelea sp.]